MFLEFLLGKGSISLPKGINMILLVAGASHTGKTAFAQKLLLKYGYPYLSLDHLKMGLIRSGYTTLTPLSHDSELTNYLWPIAKEMIKTAIEKKAVIYHSIGPKILSQIILFIFNIAV